MEPSSPRKPDVRHTDCSRRAGRSTFASDEHLHSDLGSGEKLNLGNVEHVGPTLNVTSYGDDLGPGASHLFDQQPAKHIAYISACDGNANLNPNGTGPADVVLLFPVMCPRGKSTFRNNLEMLGVISLS